MGGWPFFLLGGIKALLGRGLSIQKDWHMKIKSITFLTLFTLLKTLANAQPVFFDSLESPALKIRMAPGGAFPASGPIAPITYKYLNREVSLLFSGNTWFGWKQNQYRFAHFPLYYQPSQQMGGRPGPIEIGQTVINADSAANSWNRLFVCTKSEVNDFRHSFYMGYPLSNISSHILQWPGSRNPHLGFQVPMQMAPFIDVNGDGVYDPLQGDYPDLLGNQVAFSVTSLLKGVSTNIESSVGVMIKTEVILLPPTINDSYVNRVILVKQSFKNQTFEDLDTCNIGIWQDVDLGYPGDDFVQYDLPRVMGVTYNGDDYDESTAIHQGFEANPPAFGCSFLDSPVAFPNDGIDNDHDGSVDELDEKVSCSYFFNFTDLSIKTGFPQTISQAFNSLSGLWKDGTPLTYDLRNGISPLGTSIAGIFSAPACRYLYPGESDTTGFGVGGNLQNPQPLPPWIEESAGNPSRDRNSIMCAGPFSLASGQEVSLTYALLVSKPGMDTLGAAGGFNNLLADYDSLIAAYQTLTSIREQAPFSSITIGLTPNPAQTQTRISSTQPLTNHRYILRDMLGRTLMEGAADAPIQTGALPAGSYQVTVSGPAIHKSAILIRQ